MTVILIKRRNLDTDMYRGKMMWRHEQKTAIYKAKPTDLEEIIPSQPSEGTNSTNTLTVHFQPPELW